MVFLVRNCTIKTLIPDAVEAHKILLLTYLWISSFPKNFKEGYLSCF